jgi:hypothetical protein
VCLASRPGRLYPQERPCIHCRGGWVGLGAGLDRCGKSRPARIRSPDFPARSESLYRLRYPGNRNEYQVYLLGDKGGRCVRLTTLPPSCAVVMKSGNLNFLEPSGPLQACKGTALPLPLPFKSLTSRCGLGRKNTAFHNLSKLP